MLHCIAKALRVTGAFPNEKRSVSGVVDYLSTEICTSQSRRFPLVTFVDSPGLVDGDMVYPFDVNRTLVWIGTQRSPDQRTFTLLPLDVPSALHYIFKYLGFSLACLGIFGPNRGLMPTKMPNGRRKFSQMGHFDQI